jgi:predicted TIM-barrel fold metal-dependent hydrolase
MIVDTPVHVVSGDRGHYPMLPGAPDWPVTEIDPLIVTMDSLGIDRAVLVQTFFTYGPDNSYMVDCAKRYPDRLQTVCVIDQTRPDAADVLSGLVENKGVRGLRLMPKGHVPGVLTNPVTFPVWQRAADLKIPVTIAAEEEHIPSLHSIVDRFGDVTICLEHMWALELDPALTRMRPMLEFARYPNVHLKLAPNNSVAVKKASIKSEQFFGCLADSFGIERMMWGSNYPAHTKAFGSLEDRLKIMQDDFAFMDAAARERFFGGTAMTIWPFP